jgi:hypothetical protein
MLPRDEQLERCSPRSVLLNAKSWAELIPEIQERFPLLANHILTETGQFATGFVLVVNDEIMPTSDATLDIGADDEIAVLASFAGG